IELGARDHGRLRRQPVPRRRAGQPHPEILARQANQTWRDACDPTMKITAIKPYAIATPVTDWALVKVETDEHGIFGWGECSLPGKPSGVVGAIRDLEKLVLGQDPLNSEFLWQRMYRHGYWRGGPIQTTAMSGVDVALWDIRGKAWSQPL